MNTMKVLAVSAAIVISLIASEGVMAEKLGVTATSVDVATPLTPEEAKKLGESPEGSERLRAVEAATPLSAKEAKKLGQSPEGSERLIAVEAATPLNVEEALGARATPETTGAKQ